MMSKKNSQSEIAVIGGGPVGSYVALHAAKKGLAVKVFEEHPQIGVPSHCAGHISIRSLKAMELYQLPEGIIENTFSTANFYSPQGTKFRLNLSCPVTAALNRARLDQHLAQQAISAGAEFVLDSRVESLLMQNGATRGVQVKTGENNRFQFYSKIVIDAEGISSRLVRQTGLPTLKTESIVYAVEAEMEGVQDLELDAVEVYFGKTYAPGFYGWVIPRRDGSAKVGLATNSGNPQEYLRRLITKHPVASKQIGKAKITSIGYHAITLGGPIPQAYTDGFLAAGDCASQVKPTTGGGVIFGLTAAKEAAEVASKALAQGDVSARSLQEYQKRCNELFNFDIRVMRRLRGFLDALSDERLDEMLRVCSRFGIDSALREVTEIDFQGKMLLNVAAKPSMLAALGYFALLYLTANA
jgi:digeranylgeranylglycerophospholipid reductase